MACRKNEVFPQPMVFAFLPGDCHARAHLVLKWAFERQSYAAGRLWHSLPLAELQLSDWMPGSVLRITPENAIRRRRGTRMCKLVKDHAKAAGGSHAVA
jgi:hypothetical protein